jgi:tryptophan-rich sensory protein
MKNTNWKVYTLWIGLSEAAGLLSGLLSRGGMENFSQTVAQPPLSPPGWLFPVVWTILYGLMGISAARIWISPPSDNRSRGLNLFMAQLIVNFFWSPIFFNTGVYSFALLWLLLLWVLVVLMIFSFQKVDKTAALLQIPYLIWLTFAAYLNRGVWQLNP